MASMRTIDWVEGEIRLIDQTRLPDDLVVLRIGALDPLIDAIARLAVRGAPALGVAGALGVALLAAAHPGDEAAVRAGAARLRAARPTAVNLAWGVDRALARLGDGPGGRPGRGAPHPGRGHRGLCLDRATSAPTWSARWSPGRGSAP